jgi:sulfur carrier protein
MNISYNGEKREVPEGATVHVIAGGFRGVAVAVNGTVVPAASWPQARLAEGDVVEVVTAHQGG